MTNKDIIYSRGEASLIKLEAKKRGHYLPASVTESDMFKKYFKVGVRNIVELHDGYIVIRPKDKLE